MTETVVVGIADCAVSAKAGATLVTYALGSCIGVAMYDPIARVGGLLHFMLPLSVLAPRHEPLKPCMYCDTGLQALIDALARAGAERQRLVVKAAGGAQVLDRDGYFDIGGKNERILRQMLAAYRMPLAAAELGGSASRTVGLDIDTGRFWMKQWQVGVTGAPSPEAREVAAL